jgi:hypothetical protein
MDISVSTRLYNFKISIISIKRVWQVRTMKRKRRRKSIRRKRKLR